VAHVERFSDRVADYTLYRPSYPAALIELLKSYGLRHGAAVMDAGSGTGILSELLLREGARVYAVEPNQPMREEAESRLGHDANFLSIAGAPRKQRSLTTP
jgi:2-polyprenyl-3-methyl-5-hydroxy-6-metoxy-1,4-benzoquinol methylase